MEKYQTLNLHSYPNHVIAQWQVESLEKHHGYNQWLLTTMTKFLIDETAILKECGIFKQTTFLEIYSELISSCKASSQVKLHQTGFSPPPSLPLSISLSNHSTGQRPIIFQV